MQLTVIATGFDRYDTPEPPQYTQRSSQDQRTTGQARPEAPRSGPPANNDYKVRTFDREDLDIPSFLRRSRNNGR